MSRSEFFRDAKTKNLKLTLIGGKNYEWIKENRPRNLSPRAIVKVQTNVIYLEDFENDEEVGPLEIPPASLMEYDGEHLKIYKAGLREMNDEEKKNQKRAEDELARYTTENPYSDSFWHMKAFYRKCSTPWIAYISGTVKGKCAAQGSDYGKIIDNAIKGTLILEYSITSENLSGCQEMV